MPNNIYLTGFMGSGKSRVGRELARRLGRPHLDTDQLFQESQGISPGDFIRQQGEEAFRKEEQALLRQVAREQEFTVISTGGGIPVYPGNREIMRESGLTATLQISLEAIAARLSPQEKAQRPLWDEERFRQRQPFYQDCEIRLDATRTPQEVAEEFCQKARDFLQEAPRRCTAFQKLLRQCARESARFGLLQPQDRILLGLSGGEDSFLLLELLHAIARKAPFPLEILAATIHVGYPGFQADPIRQYCQERGWEFHLRAPDLYPLLAPEKVGNKPCPLCSRLRRGQLHHLLRELRCNKLALGHHLDDLCVSFLMSLFHGGGLKTMGPCVPADQGSATLIRPLWGIAKAQIHQAASLFPFPTPQPCPYEPLLEEQGDRHFLEQTLDRLEERFPHLREAMKQSLGDLRPRHLLDPRFWESPPAGESLPPAEAGNPPAPL